jgi:long-chain acyl-CoA synthetase
MDVRTVPDLIQDALERHRKPDAFLVKRAERWEPVPMERVLARVAALGAALRGRGIRAGDRVMILAESSLEWAIADMAILSVGAVSVPVYHTLPSAQIVPLASDSGSVGAFASSKEQSAKLDQVRGQAPGLRWIWCWDQDPLPEGGAADRAGVAADPASRPDAALQPDPAPRPDDLASIIYTSGTTGVPKGVMLTHGNIVSEAILSLRLLSIARSDVYLSFLPLSHVFERCAGLYTMLHAGATIAYAESFDRMPRNLMEVRPTILLAVPRFYEKMLERASHAAAAAGGLRGAIFEWARRVAVAWGRRRDAKQPIPISLAAQHALANALVYKIIDRRLGGRVRLRVSGGAALNRDVAYFFYGAGQPIFEGYGLTETSAAICFNNYAQHRVGTVGQVMPEVEVRIAEDGEILVRGPVVMKGYWNRPEETAEALRDGWFQTGDIGQLGADGLLRITDRKKDVIVTSGGKKVAPQPIEDALKASPRISEAMVLGEGKKFVGALIVPAAGATQDQIAADVEKVNGSLAQFEQIRRFELIPDNLTIESGLITPSLKLKRAAVTAHHRDLIARLFEGA